MPKKAQKAEGDDKKNDAGGEGQASPRERMPHGRALNRWDPEAERDLIMACLTSENNNYPTINWPRVKLIMDDLGYKFSRSALDQRWSKKIMKEWRDREGPATETDFVDPNTANNTPARKRGRVNAVNRAKANRQAANGVAITTRGRADTAITATRNRADAHLATRNLAGTVFGEIQGDADDEEDTEGNRKKFVMQPPKVQANKDVDGETQGDVEGDAQGHIQGDSLSNQGESQGDGQSADRDTSPSGLMFPISHPTKVEDVETDEITAMDEPPKKRRARRNKAEMAIFRAQQEANRVKRANERVKKRAAKEARQSIKKEPAEIMDFQTEGPMNQMNTPAFPGGAVDAPAVGSLDMSPNHFPGATQIIGMKSPGSASANNSWNFGAHAAVSGAGNPPRFAATPGQNAAIYNNMPGFNAAQGYNLHPRHGGVQLFSAPVGSNNLQHFVGGQGPYGTGPMGMNTLQGFAARLNDNNYRYPMPSVANFAGGGMVSRFQAGNFDSSMSGHNHFSYGMGPSFFTSNISPLAQQHNPVLFNLNAPHQFTAPLVCNTPQPSIEPQHTPSTEPSPEAQLLAENQSSAENPGITETQHTTPPQSTIASPTNTSCVKISEMEKIV